MTRKTPIHSVCRGYKSGLRTPVQHRFSLELARCSKSVSHSNKLYLALMLSHVWKFFSNPSPDNDGYFKEIILECHWGTCSQPAMALISSTFSFNLSIIEACISQGFSSGGDSLKIIKWTSVKGILAHQLMRESKRWYNCVYKREFKTQIHEIIRNTGFTNKEKLDNIY